MEIPEQHQVKIDQLIVCNVCMSVVTLGDGLVILGVLGDHCVQRVHDDSGLDLDILSSGQHNPLIICRVHRGTAAHCTAPPSTFLSCQLQLDLGATASIQSWPQLHKLVHL